MGNCTGKGVEANSMIVDCTVNMDQKIMDLEEADATQSEDQKSSEIQRESEGVEHPDEPKQSEEPQPDTIKQAQPELDGACTVNVDPEETADAHHDDEDEAKSRELKDEDEAKPIEKNEEDTEQEEAQKKSENENKSESGSGSKEVDAPKSDETCPVNTEQNVVDSEEAAVDDADKDKEKEKETEAEQVRMCFNEENHGGNLEFLDGNTVKKINNDEPSFCIFGEEISSEMWNECDFKIKWKSSPPESSGFYVGYIRSHRDRIRYWKTGLGGILCLQSVGYYVYSGCDYFRELREGNCNELGYRAPTNLKPGDTFGLSIDFKRDTITIRHNDCMAAICPLYQNKKVTLALSLQNEGEEIEVISCELK